MLRQRQNCHSPGLGKCLQDQYSGHHRISRKMSGKIRFIEGYVFASHRSDTGLQLLDSIDQQKRMSMGQDLHDFLCIINWHCSSVPRMLSHQLLPRILQLSSLMLCLLSCVLNICCGYSVYFFNSKLALCPPKPNELVSA